MKAHFRLLVSGGIYRLSLVDARLSRAGPSPQYAALSIGSPVPPLRVSPRRQSGQILPRDTPPPPPRQHRTEPIRGRGARRLRATLEHRARAQHPAVSSSHRGRFVQPGPMIDEVAARTTSCNDCMSRNPAPCPRTRLVYSWVLRRKRRPNPSCLKYPCWILNIFLFYRPILDIDAHLFTSNCFPTRGLSDPS